MGHARGWKGLSLVPITQRGLFRALSAGVPNGGKEGGMTDQQPILEDEIAAYLDHGFSKEETAKECGISVEVLNALLERWMTFKEPH